MENTVIFASVSTEDVLQALTMVSENLDASNAFVNGFPRERFPEAFTKAQSIAENLQVFGSPASGVLGIVSITATLLRTVLELTSKVNELQACVGRNSRNSSKPPSTDGYAKPKSKGAMEESDEEDGSDGKEGDDLEDEDESDDEEGDDLEDEYESDDEEGDDLEDDASDDEESDGLEEDESDDGESDDSEEDESDDEGGDDLEDEGVKNKSTGDPSHGDPKSDDLLGRREGETEEEYLARVNRIRSLRNLIDPENAHDGSSYQCGCVLPEHAEILGAIDYWPEKCKGCPHFEECKEDSVCVLTRNVVDVKITVTVQSHVAHAMHCPEDGSVVAAASFPEDVRSSIQYGIYVQTLVIILTCFGFMSWEKTREVMASIMGRSFGKGNMQRIIHELAEKLKPTVELIKNALWLSMVVGADETGYRVDGKLAWVHIACNAFFTYVSVSAHRGREGMDEAGFLEYYENILMTDCWKSYLDSDFHFTNGLCNAHLLRELFGIAMFMEKDSEWATELMILLLEMNHKRIELKAQDRTEFSAKEKAAFYKEWGRIIAKGLALNPERRDKNGKRIAQGKVRCLLERLVKYHKGFCMFVESFEVPFTNNTSESGLRPISCKSGISGCFQSPEGARDFMIIWSYLSSCRKHKLSMMDAVLAGFDGTSAEFLFGEDIPECPENVRKAKEKKAAAGEEACQALERAGFTGFIPLEDYGKDEKPEEEEIDDKLLIDKLILYAEKQGATVLNYKGTEYSVEELKQLREAQVQTSKDEKQVRKAASERARREREEKKNKPYAERLNAFKKKAKEELEKHKAKKMKKMSKTAQAVINEVV